MFEPETLQKINSRMDTANIVSHISDFLIENNIYDFLIDALWENIQGQKKH